MLRPILLACLALANGGGATAGIDDGGIRAALPELKRLMRAGIDVKRPNHSFTRRAGSETIFDGSFDWHSCVIAHWSLLVQARLDEDEELESFLLERLATNALEREVLTLKESEGARRVTFPYDHAWFLMLLAELERHVEGERAESVRAFRLETEAAILAALEERPFPENEPPKERGGKDYCGFYRSWLFAYLLMVWSDPVTEGAGETLARLARERIEPHRAGISTHDDPHGFDFLWIPAVLALIDRAREDGDVAPYTLPDELGPFPDDVTLGTVHVLGLELSRLWPLAADGRGDAEAKERYEMRVHAFLERPDLWSEDFAVCSHWVPQFLWIGAWLADGRP